MAFTDLTSTASIRAALGVSERELRDEVLIDPIYSVQLSEALFAIHADLFDDFVTTVAIAEDTRTRTEQRFVDLVQTFSAYHVANQCLGSVAMFAPTMIKDDRTELQRTDPYKNLRADLPGALAVLSRSLRSVYALVNTEAVVTTPNRINVLASPLGVNPVTG